MAGKKETSTEASWRPFAQKLSGFMRHGSSKNRKVSPSLPVREFGDAKLDDMSIYTQKTNRPAYAESIVDFKPLEVDIQKLESFRLAEGWLEAEQPKKPDPELLKKKPLPKPPPSSSATPIADLFVSQSLSQLDLPSDKAGDRGRRHTQIYFGSGGSGIIVDAPIIARKPVPTSPTSTITTSTTKPPATHEATYSILERGRPIEPKDLIPDPVPETEEVNAGITSNLHQKRLSLQSSQSNKAWSRDRIAPAPHSPAKSEFGAVGPRHSMYAVVPSSTRRVDVGTRPLQAPGSSTSATPLDRIQAWQKSITLAPGAPTSNSAAPGSMPVRKVSPRGVAGNRLAWIRELEEKKSSDLAKDVGVLKKQVGSVSDKLAMFESRSNSAANNGTTPAVNPRLPPLSRTNSTTSRMSSIGLKSTNTSAYDNAAATPRTSIDTARSSHRTSGVLSHFDDSFREKMESLVSAYAEKDDEDKPEGQKKQRPTSTFIPIQGAKKEEAAAAEPTKPEVVVSEVISEEAEAAAEAEPVKPEAVVSDVKPEEDKKEEEQPVAAPTTTQEESKTDEVETTPAAEPEQADEPIVEAEKVEETPSPAETVVPEEVPAKVEEVPAQTEEVPAQAEEETVAAAPEVAEEKVAEEPVVSQPEPEIVAEQPAPVEQAAETVVPVVSQEKPSEPTAAAALLEPSVMDEAVSYESAPVQVIEESKIIESAKEEQAAPVPVAQEETPAVGAAQD